MEVKIHFDAPNKRVFINEHEVRLTRNELIIFSILFRNVNKLVKRSDLIYATTGTRAEIKTRSVDVHVSSLRRKIGAICPVIINSVYKRGYMLAYDPNFLEN